MNYNKEHVFKYYNQTCSRISINCDIYFNRTILKLNRTFFRAEFRINSFMAYLYVTHFKILKKNVLVPITMFKNKEIN